MDGATFSTKRFYGCSSLRKARLRLLKSECFRVKCPSEFRKRIDGPTYCWKSFYRQSAAFEFAAKTAQDICVFAFESSSFDNEEKNGQRKYIATTLPLFWHYYSQLDDSKKHHYELIKHGSTCKLYFDLEYQRERNPNCDGNFMVDTLIKFVSFCLKETFNIDCDRSCVLDLDSSTESKFSRHLIFQLADASFANNIVVGYFVRHIFSLLETAIEMKNKENIPISLDSHSLCFSSPCSEALEENVTADDSFDKTLNSPPSLQEPKIGNKRKENSVSSEHKMIKDELHYSCFTIDSDVKPTKSHYQGDSKHDDHILRENNATSHMANSMCSTVAVQKITNTTTPSCEDEVDTNRPVDKPWHKVSATNCDSRRICKHFTLKHMKCLFVKNKDGKYTPFCDLGVYTKNRNFRLYKSSKMNKHNPLVLAAENTFVPSPNGSEKDIFYASLVCEQRHEKDVHILHFGNAKESTSKIMRPSVKYVGKNPDTDQGEGFLQGTNSLSPYPEVDFFIQSLVSGKGCSGAIRRWTYFTLTESIIYDIIGYRWCGNIQREHRSNNIMYVVDLKRGVYYQKCYDPECQTAYYKSQEMLVPKNCLPGSLLELDDMDQVCCDVFHCSDDDLLVRAAREVEQGSTQLFSECYTSRSCTDTNCCNDEDYELVTAVEECEENLLLVDTLNTPENKDISFTDASKKEDMLLGDATENSLLIAALEEMETS